MIVFIKLVKRASILHEKFFIYKYQLTTNHTIPNNQINNTSEYFQNTTKQPNNQTTKQTNKQLYFIILHNTKQYTKQTKLTNQTTKLTNSLINSLDPSLQQHMKTLSYITH